MVADLFKHELVEGVLEPNTKIFDLCVLIWYLHVFGYHVEHGLQIIGGGGNKLGEAIRARSSGVPQNTPPIFAPNLNVQVHQQLINKQRWGNRSFFYSLSDAIRMLSISYHAAHSGFIPFLQNLPGVILHIVGI